MSAHSPRAWGVAPRHASRGALANSRGTLKLEAPSSAAAYAVLATDCADASGSATMKAGSSTSSTSGRQASRTALLGAVAMAYEALDSSRGSAEPGTLSCSARANAETHSSWRPGGAAPRRDAASIASTQCRGVASDNRGRSSPHSAPSSFCLSSARCQGTALRRDSIATRFASPAASPCCETMSRSSAKLRARMLANVPRSGVVRGRSTMRSGRGARTSMLRCRRGIFGSGRASPRCFCCCACP